MPCAAAILPMLLAATGLPTSHAAAQPAVPAEITAATDIVTTTQDRFDRMTVPVTVIGQGPFRFLVDTGSQNTVISNDLAARLALVPTARATLVSMGARRPVDTVWCWTRSRWAAAPIPACWCRCWTETTSAPTGSSGWTACRASAC